MATRRRLCQPIRDEFGSPLVGLISLTLLLPPLQIKLVSLSGDGRTSVSGEKGILQQWPPSTQRSTTPLRCYETMVGATFRLPVPGGQAALLAFLKRGNAP